MLKAVSTHLFLRQRLHPGHLDTLAQAGAQAVEIFCARQHFDYTSRTHIRELANWFSSASVRPLGLHAPIYGDMEMGRSGAPAINLIHPEKARRIDAMDEIKRALEVADLLPFGHMVLHLGERSDTWSLRTLEHSMTALEHLQAFARPMGVTLLVENMVSEATQPARLVEVLETGHLDAIGVCLDVGHANIGEGVDEAFAVLGKRVRSCHLHDNHGERDEHLWPGEGKIDWPATLEAVNQVGAAGVLEIHYTLGEAGAATTEKLRQALALLDGD